MNQPILGIPVYNANGSLVGYECPNCFGKGEYSGSWDSYACLNCMIWLDNGCKCALGDSADSFVAAKLEEKAEMIEGIMERNELRKAGDWINFLEGLI